MFDKLIESNSEKAEFKPRRKFFMMSSVVVGILFLSAVVFSLYAQDIDLGTDQFELSVLLAPVDNIEPEPEPPSEIQPQNRNDNATSELPSRRELIARIDQHQNVPTTVSTTPNTHRPIPEGKFTLDSMRPDSDGSGSNRPTGDGVGSSVDAEPIESEVVKTTAPPPAIKPVEPRPPTMITGGVVNGKATFLPNPAYPETAKRVGAVGVVNVQVTIDESGKVISSKAVSGHPLLRGTAESSAWKARFSPTYLSKVPVKVTGVIIFNFKRS